MRVGDAQGRHGVAHDEERDHHAGTWRGTPGKTPRAPRPSSLPSRARSGGSGNSISRTRMASSSAGSSTDATTGGNALRDEALRPSGSPAPRTARKVAEVPALLGQAAHEIEDRVDEAPGQVAAQSTHEHGRERPRAPPRRRSASP